MTADRPRAWPDLVLLSLLAAAVILLRTQGWRATRLNNPDMLPYYSGALALVQSGALPDRGDISSYDSYSPPGTTYLMLPGLLLTRDARLQRVPGDVLVFAGTILLLYLAVTPILGRGIGLTSAAATAVSSIGYQGIYPVGHPVFVLGALAALAAWVNGRRRWALPLAVLSLAAGLYADLGIMPYVLVVAAVWLIFRPKTWWPGVAIAIAIALLLWLPYLRFEAGRGFSDLASILTLRRLDSGGAESQACLAVLPGESETMDGVFIPYMNETEAQGRMVAEGGSAIGNALHRACVVFANLDGNFDSAEYLTGRRQPLAALMYLVTLIGMTALLVGWLRSRSAVTGEDGRRRVWPRWAAPALALVGAAALYVMLDPHGIAPRLTADGSLSEPARLVLAQARAYLPLVWFGVTMGAWLGWRTPSSSSAGLLALSLWIPYLLLILLAEPGRVERFRFLWPLQVTALVYAVMLVVPRGRRPLWRIAAGVLLVVALLPTAVLAAKARAWAAQGYSGPDAGETALVDDIARGALASGATTLTVGYDASGRPAGEMIADSYHRPGAWIDYLLATRHGIRNERPPGEFLSAEDDYRVRDTSIGGDGRSMSAMAAPAWPEYHLVAILGPLEVYQRLPAAP
jgi:hypothetical protein